MQNNGYKIWTPSIADHDGQPDLDEWVEKVEGLAPRKKFDLMVGDAVEFWEEVPIDEVRKGIK